MAQFTPFELIVLVGLGDLVQQGVTHNDFSVTGAILAIFTFAFWASVLGWVTYLSPRAEALLDGKPSVIVRDGEWEAGAVSDQGHDWAPKDQGEEGCAAGHRVEGGKHATLDLETLDLDKFALEGVELVPIKLEQVDLGSG